MKLFRSDPEIHLLFRELYVLLKAGIPLPRALELLALQKTEISQNLLELKTRIEQGEDLSEAFRKSGLFPEFMCEMLVAAQTGESLENIFLKASDWLSRLEEFKSRITGALIYPSLILSLSIISIIIVLEFIVPKLRKILLSFGRDLPFATKVLVLGSKILWWLLILGAPLFFIIFLLWVKRNGWEEVHRLILKIPIVGRLWIAFDLSRWTYTTALLIEAGLVLPRAVSAGAQSCGNRFLKRHLMELVERLEEGHALSFDLHRLSVVPPFVSELVAIGEETGTLSEMLRNASELLIKEADRLIDRTLKWIEPLTILIIGLIVAYIVVSVILPIMEISSSVKL